MAPYAFYGCGLLNIVEFDEDSELESIGAQSFEKSCFEGLSIPPSAQKTSKDAFSNCHFLRLIEFHENSKLDSFDIKIVENLSDELIIYAPKELSKLFIKFFKKKKCSYGTCHFSARKDIGAFSNILYKKLIYPFFLQRI